MGLGFVLVHNNGWPDTARVCRQFIKDEDRYLSLTDCLKSNRTPLGHYVLFHPMPAGCTTDGPGVWWCSGPDLGGDTIRWLRSVVRHAYKHVGTSQITEYHFQFVQWNSGKIFFSLLVFWVSWNSSLCRLFISIKQYGILLFLHILNQQRYPSWFFPTEIRDTVYLDLFLYAVC